MHVDSSTVRRNGKSYTRHLLRESYREAGKVKHRTIANISRCSHEEIDAIRLALKHKRDLTRIVAAAGNVALGLIQGPSVGAVWLLWQLARELGIAAALGSERQGKLALWQVIARALDQGSRLSAVRLARGHAAAATLGLDGFDEDDLYANLDWLAEKQATIETRLFRGRAAEASPGIFLYDVTSSYLEGTQNAFAAFGYNRDGKRGKRQIVIGLLCDGDGQPLSIEVFAGNTAAVGTVSSQLEKAAARFGARRVTLVGDRGMIEGPQIAELKHAGFHYITAITKAQIDGLVKAGVVQMDLFDAELAEVEGLHGERYVLRRNPARAEELAASRRDELAALDAETAAANTYLEDHPRAKLSVQVRILGDRIRKLRLGDLVDVAVADRSLGLRVDAEALLEAARVDGCYALRTDLSREAVAKEVVHERYKDLARVEKAFRDGKTVHLEIRPIHVRGESRTRGHALVVMLAYLLVRQLRRRWHDVDLIVQQGLDLLTSLCLTEVRIDGRAPYYQVPAPRDEVRQLFEAAGVPLPEVLPFPPTEVATEKKLPPRRKRK